MRALVRDPAKEREFAPSPVLTDDFMVLRDDPRVDVVAEVMGGLEPAGDHVRALLRAGKPVVSANKQLVAREGAELLAVASAAGVQLRFEASVCAAVPVVKVLRESLVAENVHSILGIVNRTTNFVLSRMERGGTYTEALAEAQTLGSPRRIRPTTSPERTLPRRSRSSRRSRSAPASCSPTPSAGGSRRSSPRTSPQPPPSGWR